MKFIYIAMWLLTLTGCVNYPVNRYAVSVDNVISIKANNAGKKINIGKFSSLEPDLKVISCRAVGPIMPPDGETYAEYIRKAFIDELKTAEAYSANGPITLTGQLNKLTLSSTSGYWDISLTVNSSNGQTVTVMENYKFQTSFQGDNACQQTSLSLMPLIQVVVGKVLTGDNFMLLTK